jgi:hypothetical protein
VVYVGHIKRRDFFFQNKTPTLSSTLLFLGSTILFNFFLNILPNFKNDFSMWHALMITMWKFILQIDYKKLRLVSTCTTIVAICSGIAIFLNWNAGGHTRPVPGFSSSTHMACKTHQYKTQIVSLEPLVVYIENFVGQNEAQELLRIG